ncbi:hypothetical protein, partial [Azospirillum picis]
MAKQKALELITRLATDNDFRNALNSASAADKQAILAQNGYSGMTPEDVRGAAAEAFTGLTGNTGVSSDHAVESVAFAASMSMLAGTAAPAASASMSMLAGTAAPAASASMSMLAGTAAPAASASMSMLAG